MQTNKIEIFTYRMWCSCITCQSIVSSARSRANFFTGKLYGYLLPLLNCQSPKYNYDDYLSKLKQRLRQVHQIARERLIRNKDKTKVRYDNQLTIHVNDKVLGIQDKTRKEKLSSKWLGPYDVFEIDENENVTIQKGRRKVKVYKNLLKSFHNSYYQTIQDTYVYIKKF